MLVKKLIKWLMIPFVLFFLAVLLTLVFFFNSDINPNILSSNYPLSHIGRTDTKITGYFKAEHDYLGIVTIPFKVNYKLNGLSVFRIKNVLDDDWYHTATISANQYYALPNYAFGLPIIKNSKNQTYVFEVELLNSGLPIQSLKINDAGIYFKSQYVYPRELLLENKSMLLGFIENKSLYYLQSSNAWRVLIVYFLPFLFYFLIYGVGLIKLFNRIFKEKIFTILRRLKKPSFIILLAGIFIDIFVLGKYSDYIVLYLISGFTLTNIVYNNQIDTSYFISVIFLLFCPFLIWAKMDWIIEKSAIWAYMFMVAGTVQGVVESNSFFIKISKINYIRFFINLIKIFIKYIDFIIEKLINYLSLKTSHYLKLFFNKIPNTFTGWIKFISKVILLSFVILILSVLIFYISLEIYRVYRIKDHQRIRQTLNPNIAVLEPKLVYKATNIVIYGSNFDWKTDDNIYLLVDGKKTDVSLWTNSEIVFQVPLDWKIGEHQVWIEKPIVWDGQQELAKSAIYQFKILPITDEITKNDELYFEQLKTLRKETLNLNGYN